MPSNNVLRWNASSYLAKIFLELVLILFPTCKYLEHVSAFQSLANDEFVAKIWVINSTSLFPLRMPSACLIISIMSNA